LTRNKHGHDAETAGKEERRNRPLTFSKNISTVYEKLSDRRCQGALACSEIGLKWFLFALHDLGTALGFVSVVDFFGDFVFPENRRNGQNGIKTIFDHFRNTHAR
jgi:hypothetical protein